MKRKTVKKVKKQIRRTYKRRPKLVATLLIIILLLFVGAFVYLYSEGYLDSYIPENPEKPGFTLFEQDENGFYYYQTDYKSGDYYFSAKNLTGEALAEELHEIINKDFNRKSYGEARYILAYSDRDPSNNNESVRGIYDNAVIATVWIGSGTGAWQREHVWPNSKLGIPSVNNNSKNQGSDLHNLRAITGINQTRSNRYFAAGSGVAKTVGSEGFYPGDDHKGDVARILFYMAIMYDFLTLTNDVSKLVNDPDTNYTLEGAYAGILDLLLEWHKEDPVDEFELQRNEFIYSGIAYDPNGKEITPQGNRNPFIDHPEYVHLIWEGKEIEDLLKPEVQELTFKMPNMPLLKIYYIKFTRENGYLV